MSLPDGAPPVPPPGGYRGATRTMSSWRSADEAAAREARDVEGVTVTPRKRERVRPNWLSIAALSVSALFAVVLVLLAFFGQGSSQFYGINMLAIQMVVLGLAIAAFATKRGRALGAGALVLALLVNSFTVGGFSAVNAAATGNYDEKKSADQKFWEAYPGIKDVDPQVILDQPSLEDTRDNVDAMMAEIRTALTDEFGFKWATPVPESLTPARNGYGGEAMLVDYNAEEWYTTSTVTSMTDKKRVMSIVSGVLVKNGMWTPSAINEPSAGIEDDYLTKFFGSADPATQVEWSWYSAYLDGEPGDFWAGIIDLSKDTTGDFAAKQDALVAQYGTPREGITLTFRGKGLLSDQIRGSFIQAMAPYGGA
ncbi:hypothetical protein GCM10022198_17140 [Klugiella xanthotipulae]|uniref:Uncharacterized protein n=1 Tax=Klugiella xanthotipulae TaxID=244735 RepID=A0A543HZ96_9MICO|nr:MerC domain-containing protein [Klugiella xanthotipulae]TQM63641.1 hypothetical protein FB466_1914 [Klugiella xanthotipulae]